MRTNANKHKDSGYMPNEMERHMKDKPSIWEFAKGSLKEHNDGSMKYILYKSKETGQLYKEVNAFKNRLIINIIYSLIAVLLFISFSLTPHLLLWDKITMIVVCIVCSYPAMMHLIRYFFIKFEKIPDETYARDSRYRGIESWFYFILIIVLVALRFYIRFAILNLA